MDIIKPFITHINMAGTNANRAYIDKVAFFGTNYSPGNIFISPNEGGYNNTNFYFDDINKILTQDDFPGYSAAQGVYQYSTNCSVFYTNGYRLYVNDHFKNCTNLAGYLCWGGHSALGGEYATDNTLQWAGASGWWIIETIESFNGQWMSDQGNIRKWHSANAFGGNDYFNTPIGSVSHVKEPGLDGINNPYLYFGLWASGRSFGACAWNSRVTSYFQAVGAPFIKR
jgi:hypothetical protein